MEALDQHTDLLNADDGRLLMMRRKKRARMELMELIQHRTLAMLLKRLGSAENLDALAEEIAAGQKDPYTVCDEVMSAAAAELKGP